MKKTTLGALVALAFAFLVLAASTQAAVTLKVRTCLVKTHDHSFIRTRNALLSPARQPVPEPWVTSRITRYGVVAGS